MNKNRKDPVFKILLIEDNPGDIRLIKELLIQANNFEFELNSSRTLNEGLEKIQKNVYDIVLLDLSLPDCRGVETIKKAQKEVNIIPLIVLTGLEDENLARRTVKLGAHNYFVKGQITSNRLVRAIYHAIDRKKMLKKIHNLASFPSDNPSPVLRVNKERILYANSAARSLFGIRKGDNNPPCLEENINETFKKNDLVSSKINKKGKHYSFILKPIDQSHYINIHYINIYGMDITQLKKAEHAKEQSERRYLELFNHINDAIFIYDLKGNMLDFNKTAMNRLGYSREDLMKLTPMDFESPKFANKVPKKIEEIKRKGHLIMETAHQTKEGKVIPIELNSKIITYGGKEAILSVARDITERKNYEQNIKKSEKRYRDLFDNSPYPIIISNLNGKIVGFNSALLKISGYNRKEIIKKSFKESKLFPKSYSEYFKIIFQELQEKSRVKPLELQCQTKEKNSIWLKLNFSLITLENEQMFYILGQDITELKKSKERLHKTEKALQELNTLIEDAPTAIVLLESRGKILRMNREAKELFECVHKKKYKRSIFEFFPETELDKVIRHYEEDIYYPKKMNKFETIIHTYKDHSIEVEITSTILKVSERIIIQSFISDITERKVHEKKRNMLLDELLTTLEFKSKFLATMSHELRTPLNAIIGFTNILLGESYGELNETQKEFLDDVDSASNHLAELIGSVLDISKFEVGKLKLNIRKINLCKIVKEVITLLKPEYERKGIEFICQSITPEDTLTADPLRFKQILENLLTNAIKFTNKGHVKFKGIERADHWEFQIIDTGIGIKKKNFEVIFREFGRVENDVIEKVPGAGIGLALTRRLVRLHGGDIWFESEYGKGTTFFFTVPKRKGKGRNLN